MIKLISKFCSLQKYYPTKLVTPKEWVGQKYIPIFKQKQLTEKEQKQLMYIGGAKLFPLTGFSLYWLFYGAFDILHFMGFTSLFLIYAKQRFNSLNQAMKKPEFMYMDKNGLDYIVVYNKNPSSVDEDNEEQIALKELFQLNDKFGIVRFNVNDFKIVQSGVEPKTEYEFANLFILENAEEEMSKKQHNIYEIDVQQKLILIKFTQNDLSGMNEYLSALLSKKQIIIK